MLNELSRKISDKIADNTGGGEQQRQVIAYGVLAILNISAFLLTAVILGAAFGALLPILTVCLSGALFRQSSGGAHAHSSFFCTFIGCIVCLLFSLLCKYAAALPIPGWAYIALTAAVFIAAFAATAALVPVDSPAKPIKSEKKKKRMKRNSYITLAAYLLILVVYLAMSRGGGSFRLFLLSLCAGVGWQSLTLTKPGARLMETLQAPLVKCATLFSHRRS